MTALAGIVLALVAGVELVMNAVVETSICPRPPQSPPPPQRLTRVSPDDFAG